LGAVGQNTQLDLPQIVVVREIDFLWLEWRCFCGCVWAPVGDSLSPFRHLTKLCVCIRWFCIHRLADNRPENPVSSKGLWDAAFFLVEQESSLVGRWCWP
jgi:hypothetical protein